MSLQQKRTLVQVCNMTRKEIALFRCATMLLLSLMLSSCASMNTSVQRNVTATSKPIEQTRENGSGPLDSRDEIARIVAQQQNDSEIDNGINRNGRIVQLGTFVEEIPTIELPENDVIELNFEQEELQSIIQQFSDALQINVVIDATIADKVSLRTSPDNPLHYADLWPLLRMLSTNAGVTIEQAGNIYEFKKNASSIPVELIMPNWLNSATSSEVLQVTPLTFISRENAQAILAPLLQPEGSIIRLGNSNLLGISGSKGQLVRVNALLDVIDTDPFLNQGIQLYELQNSDATAVAEELNVVLQLIEGEESSYQVLGLGRINSVLVLAPAGRGFDEVERWINVLDAESQEQVEQLFIYAVKNLSAVSLAATLTSVFEQDEDNIPRDGQAEGDVANVDSESESGVNLDEITSRADNSVSANLSVTIVADEDTNSLLVRSTPRDYRQLLTTINTLDKLPLQVLINAVIGQVTLNDNTQYGVDWTRVSGNLGSGPAQLSSRILPGGILNSETGTATVGSGLVLTKIFHDGSAAINATVQAIAEDNEVSLLSRPTIMVANNQEGLFQVGQSVPIDTGSSVSGNGIVSSNVSYRDVGIELKVTPHINADGFINMEIFQSVSSVEDSNGGVSNNPIFTNQEITTTAVVEDQAMITLGGLIQEVDSNRNSGVPFLRKIPALGTLFSFRESSIERRELFIILRPQIIDGNERDTVIMQAFRSQFKKISTLFDEAGL